MFSPKNIITSECNIKTLCYIKNLNCELNEKRVSTFRKNFNYAFKCFDHLNCFFKSYMYMYNSNF